MLKKVSSEHGLVMGHEASGVVHSVGSAVTSVVEGDRVTVEPGYPCRRCGLCKAGRYNICRQMRFAASPPHPGTLARYFRIPADFVLRLPDTVTLQEAALLEPLAVAVHVCRLAGGGEAMQGSGGVAVLGSGAIGLFCAAVARAWGASRLAIADVQQKKLEFAAGYLPGCITYLVDGNSDSTEANAQGIKQKMGLSPDGGVDAVLECTGVESSAQTAAHLCAPGAIFVQAGLGRAMQALPLLAICAREITLKGAFRYGAGDYERALELVASGRVDVKSLISTVTPFEKAPEAWEKTLRGEGIKNLISGVDDETEN